MTISATTRAIPRRGCSRTRATARIPKTVATSVGDVELAIPRDRDATFTPTLVPKGSRRVGGLDDMIVSLYAGGMTVRDIEHHLASTIGTEISRETISKITDEVLDEVLAWQRRPLESFYPVIYLDAIVVKVRDGAHVRNKAAHIAVGVDMDGVKHVLGIWVQATEGAKFWAGVCAELANRGVARRAHRLLRRADRIPRGDRGDLARLAGADLRGASDPGVDAVRVLRAAQGRRGGAQDGLPGRRRRGRRGRSGRVRGLRSGQRNPNTVRVFDDAWERFIPFLAFPPMLRRVIYTTNAIESLNYQLRKIIKNRGHFPNDAAVVKLLWLAICNIEDKRARDREKERGLGRGAKRKAESRLVEGQITTNWKQALAQLALAYPDRINPYL